MPSDLSLLPAELAARSLSRESIILPPEDVPAALEHLAAVGRRVTAWEGWVTLPGGGRTRSLAHPGTFVLPLDGAQAAAIVREQVTHTVETWARRAEYPGASLYVALELAPA
ncbi:MAG TPA: hypothetical protein VGE02_05330 [Gemmatimonadales bacterium]